VESGLLLNIVVRESAPVFELLPGKDQTLLVGGDPFLILDLRLHVVDRVRRLDLERDCLAREGLDENLHASTETQDEMEGRLLLNIVIRKSAAILELLPGEDQTLLIRGDAD
jgi:hypothetical protein